MKQRDIQHIKDISSELKRGLDLLMSDDYAIMHKTNLTSTDIFMASYFPAERWAKITKQYGNALVPMFSAIKSLDTLLNSSEANNGL